MNGASTLVFAGIAPHPPIMVPEVGQQAIAEVRGSIDAMAELTARVIASGAETVILISPHAPLESRAFVAYEGPQLHGDFGNFRAPNATVSADLDEELLSAITNVAASENYQVRRIKNGALDHGTAVPLYFLQRNGWNGRVVALGYTFLSNEDHVRFGKVVRNAVDSLGRRAAFIASGDLSHRLKLGAPAGYNKDAHRFDEEVLEALQTGEPERVIEIDQDLRRLAGECGYRSMLVAIGATAGLSAMPEVLHYEAPFGVGYLVAQLVASQPNTPGAPKTKSTEEHENGEDFALASELTALARETVETFVKDHHVIVHPKVSAALKQRAACFVSIKTRDGDLRGCIGTTEPTKDTLAEELIANAIGAATHDPRFTPVAEQELASLKYSVDVLSEPEPATIKDLDPLVYGVIVEEENSGRRGLLLPNLAGVDTAEKQVGIAARKAGIRDGAKLNLWRFRATRFKEPQR
jgi:AmmeMemoRadiSam system protein A/AmmeMemoRadiSam system protein B